MHRPTKTTPNVQSADALAHLLEDFEYPIEPDDFLLYEFSRLIDEDCASFEDEEFRRAIDEGISEHAENRADVRAAIATRLRRANMDDATRRIAQRTIRALEDTGATLRNVSLIVRTYTACVFRKLQEPPAASTALEQEAQTLIERWHRGEILREQMTQALKQIGPPAVGPLANLLFDAPDDRMAAEMAIDTLGAIPCSSSARVLTHAIAEPLLAEDLEIKTYNRARALWPLQRQYMLYTLEPHSHDDIPFRWYELLIDCDELYAIDRILDEVRTHGEEPEYREDLLALLELIRRSHDPDTEEKIVATLNEPSIPKETAKIVAAFLSGFHPAPVPTDSPWMHATQMADLNQRYLAAAKLYDTGHAADALRGLNAILKDEPGYPFAVELKKGIV